MATTRFALCSGHVGRLAPQRRVSASHAIASLVNAGGRSSLSCRRPFRVAGCGITVGAATDVRPIGADLETGGRIRATQSLQEARRLRRFPVGDDKMSFEEIPVRFAYEDSYIPLGRRKSRPVNFWAEGLVRIQDISDAEAPVAYRIFGSDPKNPSEVYEIRSYDDALWWPVRDRESLISASRFTQMLATGHNRALGVLGMNSGFPREETPEVYYSRNFAKKIVASTRNENSIRLQRRAAATIFCDGTVLVQAGPPIYYCVRAFGSAGYRIEAGPSVLEMLPSVTEFRLGGIGYGIQSAPSVAAAGMAFGIHEIEDAISRLSIGIVGPRMTIENLAGRQYPDAAVLACTRAFIDDIWFKARLDTPGGTKLSELVPSLAGHGWNIEEIRRKPSEPVLQEVIAITDRLGRMQFASDIAAATSILARLELRKLSDEDDAAIWGFR